MTTREEVYKAIDSERAYQQAKFGGDAPREVGSFLVYMQDYLTEGMRKETRESAAAALDFIRKVAGLCVACMEQHGAPQREGFKR